MPDGWEVILSIPSLSLPLRILKLFKLLCLLCKVTLPLVAFRTHGTYQKRVITLGIWLKWLLSQLGSEITIVLVSVKHCQDFYVMCLCIAFKYTNTDAAKRCSGINRWYDVRKLNTFGSLQKHFSALYMHPYEICPQKGLRLVVLPLRGTQAPNTTRLNTTHPVWSVWSLLVGECQSGRQPQYDCMCELRSWINRCHCRCCKYVIQESTINAM